MRQEEQASRGTPLKSTEQMRSTKVSLLKIEVAIELDFQIFLQHVFPKQIAAEVFYDLQNLDHD